MLLYQKQLLISSKSYLAIKTISIPIIFNLSKSKIKPKHSNTQLPSNKISYLKHHSSYIKNHFQYRSTQNKSQNNKKYKHPRLWKQNQN